MESVSHQKKKKNKIDKKLKFEIKTGNLSRNFNFMDT